MIGPASIPLLAVALSDRSPRSCTVMHTSRAVAGAKASGLLDCVRVIVCVDTTTVRSILILATDCWRLVVVATIAKMCFFALTDTDRLRPHHEQRAKMISGEILVAPRSMPLRACKKSVVCSLSPSIRFILSAHRACRPVHMIPTAGLRQSPSGRARVRIASGGNSPRRQQQRLYFLSWEPGVVRIPFSFPNGIRIRCIPPSPNKSISHLSRLG